MKTLKRLSSILRPQHFFIATFLLFDCNFNSIINYAVNQNSEEEIIQLLSSSPDKTENNPDQDIITTEKKISYNVYFGDIHNHSTNSDGIATPEQAYSYTRDSAGLDFFGLADHAKRIDTAEWNATKILAESYNEDGRFVTFCGFEWSSGYGHVTVIGTDDYCSSLDQSTNSFTELCGWLSKRDCAAFFNHPNNPETFNSFSRFTTPPTDKLVGMELWNKGDGFERYYYNDGFYPDDNNKGFFDEALSRGWKIGASGGRDCHSLVWKSKFRLAVLAQQLTRDAIFSAIKARRFYSTLDTNLILSFTINNHEIGSSVTGSDLHLEINATDRNDESFNEIMLFNKNHDTVKVWNLATDTVTVSFDFSVNEDDYFYIKIRQEDGDEAISSPIWITW